MSLSPTPPTTHRPAPRWTRSLVGVLLGVAVGVGAWLLLRERGPGDLPVDVPAPRGGVSGSDDASPIETRPPPKGQESPGRAPVGPRRPARKPEVHGRVLDAHELPLVGAQVTLHAVEGGALRGLAVADGASLGVTTSDHDGTFTLPAPLAGVARLAASAAGHGRATELVTPAGAQVTLVLAREALLDVLVREPDGREVLSGEVQVEVDGTRHVQVLAAGRAQLAGLPAGPARVRVLGPEGRVGAAGPVLLEAGTTREALVVLGPGARLGGIVRDAETGEPLEGASVIVAQPGRALADAVTDASGRFGPLVVGLPGEPMQVSVTAAAHASVLLAVTSSEGPQPTELEVALEVADPWTGRVEDEAGAPAAGVDVGYTADGIAGRVPASTITDAEGRFQLPPPPPPAPGRRIVLRARTGTALAALALRPEAPRPDPLVLRLAPGATLTGRVLDDHGRALENVLVRATPAWALARATSAGSDALHAINSEGGGGLTGLSGVDGGFEVVGVPPGPWLVTLEHAGRTRTLDEPRLVERADLALGDLTLGGGLTLEGQVLTAGGAPLPGAHVRLGPIARGEARPRGATSDATGRFAFTDLEPERVWVVAEGPNGERQEAREEVDLPAPGPLTLRVTNGRGLTLDLSGPEGPVSGLVTLVLARPRGSEAGGYRASAEAEGGAVAFQGLPPGRWNLRVESGSLLAAPSEPLELGPQGDTRLALSLRAPAVLEGVLRTATGAPVARGEIVLRASAGGASRRVLSDAAGRYRFEGLAGGEHVLKARGPGGAALETRVTLFEGRTSTEALALAPAGALRLRARDAQGRPVAGALVSVHAAEPGVAGASAQGRAGADGRLLLSDLPATTLVVQARTREGLAARSSVTLEAGRVTDLELVLAR